MPIPEKSCRNVGLTGFPDDDNAVSQDLALTLYCLPLRFWQDGTVTVMKKYKAISQDVLDYPSTMSMYEKESLAAEAKLHVKKPSRDGDDMNETKVAVEKLQRIQELWRELGRTKSKAARYETLLKKIRVLSDEYQELVDAAKKPRGSK